MSDESLASVRRLFPQVLFVTTLVAVLPVAVVYELRKQGGLSSLWECVALAMVLALVTIRTASAYWQRRKPSADLMFSELLIWGWLRRLRLEYQLRDASRLLAEVAERGDQPPADREATAALLTRLTNAFQALDAYTAGHSRRVARMATGLARSVGLASEQVSTIRAAAAIHDIGKLRVPSEILNKPASLSREEYELVKRHTVEGAAMVACLGDPELTAIVRHHHERIDGSGYPDALAGEQIPIGARIVAVADTYDAIIAPRPYRPGASHKYAISVLTKDAGTQFDPEVVRTFVRSYSPSRGVLLWSGLALAAARAFAWPQARAPTSRPSSPAQHAANVGAFAVLAALAAAASASLGHVSIRATPPPRRRPPAVAPVIASSPTTIAPTHPGHRPPAARSSSTRAPQPPQFSAAPVPVTPAVTAAPAPRAEPSIESLTAACPALSAGGGECSVRWSVSNAQTCTLTATPAIPGQLPATVGCAAGSEQRALQLPANAGSSPRTLTLALTAVGAAGTTPARRDTAVTVPAPITEPEITILTAGCGTLPAGGGVCAIDWQVRNARTCTLSANPQLAYQLPATVACGSGIDQRELRVAANAGSAAQALTLTLTASGAPGATPARRQTTIVVAAAPPAQPSISSLTADCLALPAQGGSCSIAWTVGNAQTCTLAASPTLAGQLPITVGCSAGTGQAQLQLPANTSTSPQTWTLTLTAAGAVASAPASREATLTVAAQLPEPQIVSLSATCGTPPSGGGTCSVQWIVSNAQTCTLTASPPLAGQLPVTGECATGSGQTQLQLPANTGSSPQTWTLTLSAAGTAETTPATQQTSVTIDPAAASQRRSVAVLRRARRRLVVARRARRMLARRRGGLALRSSDVVRSASQASGQAAYGTPDQRRSRLKRRAAQRVPAIRPRCRCFPPAVMTLQPINTGRLFPRGPELAGSRSIPAGSRS